MTNHNLTRRTAVTAVGLGSAAFLAGCASSVRPVDAAASGSSSSSASSSSSSSSSSASASPSLQSTKDYSGTVKHEKFDKSAGEFVPATREHAASNVPIPLLDESKAQENSADGFYANISFISATIQYMFETGEDGPLQKTSLTEADKKSFYELEGFSDTLDAIKLKEVWFDNPTITITLDTAQPTYSSGDIYRWQGKIEVKLGTYIAGHGESVDLLPEEQNSKFIILFRGMHSDGKWQIRTQNAPVK